METSTEHKCPCALCLGNQSIEFLCPSMAEFGQQTDNQTKQFIPAVHR